MQILESKAKAMQTRSQLFSIKCERYASPAPVASKAKGMQIIESKAKGMQTRYPVASKAKGMQF